MTRPPAPPEPLMLLVHTPGNGFAHYECAVTLYGEDYAKGHMSRILAGDADGFSCLGCLELLGENEPERTPSPELNAPPASAATTRDGAFLALALADALGLGLPDPDYITMSPHVAGSATMSAIDFQFNDRNGQDPLPAMQAWAGRFGATIDASAGSGEQPSTWHKFEFTHAGVLFDAYAQIAAAAPEGPEDAAAQDDDAPPVADGYVTAEEAARHVAARLAASIEPGTPVIIAGGEPPLSPEAPPALPGCDRAGCRHPEHEHMADDEENADGPCLQPGCRCLAYLLPAAATLAAVRPLRPAGAS